MTLWATIYKAICHGHRIQYEHVQVSDHTQPCPHLPGFHFEENMFWHHTVDPVCTHTAKPVLIHYWQPYFLNAHEKKQVDISLLSSKLLTITENTFLKGQFFVCRQWRPYFLAECFHQQGAVQASPYLFPSSTQKSAPCLIHSCGDLNLTRQFAIVILDA
jgi:hypothetical protein